MLIFSFGTNDLTQMTFGFSRDDMGKFLPHYLQGVLQDNPLMTFDTEGVGELVKMGTTRGRHANALLKVGVCGEHGGDPNGIQFFLHGLDYVSCSPFRIPVATCSTSRAFPVNITSTGRTFRIRGLFVLENLMLLAYYLHA